MKELPNPAYNMTQMVGTSPNSWDEAIQNSLEEASKTLTHMDWNRLMSTKVPWVAISP